MRKASMLRRSFSSALNEVAAAKIKQTSKAPKILIANNGDFVLHPHHAVTSFTDPVAKVGLDAVHQFIPEYSENDRLRNLAQYNYIGMREKLMNDYKQHWLAISSNGSMFVGLHEDVVRAKAERCFHARTEDYYMDCLGSEVLMLAVMDDSNLASSLDEEGDAEKALMFDGEFSADGGKTFQTYQFKHDTGAALMGVPNEVLSQYTLLRGIDRWAVGANNKPLRANVYKDLHIRVCGATVKLDVVCMRTWLFGYDAYKHFTHDIDCERQPKLIMKAKKPDLQK
ncbi:hypothetical protein B484DRAFT_432561 [Ochromonadaceae sp. CCMP2298]|nr:hypothetical protein B484DRAFT_432561 [Ochromonadaceae sp. CCMP2298]